MKQFLCVDIQTHTENLAARGHVDQTLLGKAVFNSAQKT